MNKFVTRPFTPTDIKHIIQLFYDTVHTVNAQHYTQEQLDAWAPKDIDRAQWLHDLSRNITFVVTQGDIIVGFAQMSNIGYLDKLFVHKDYQRKGIATLLLQILEQQTRKRGIKEITTEASITALPFFKKHGFTIIKKQDKVVRGVSLINYVMKKVLV